MYKYAEIADTVYFWFASNSTTGTADDGATPLYDVRLAGAAAGAAPTASGTPTLLSHANYSAGLYEIAVDTTGYAAGEYAVFCTLTVSTVNPAGFCGSVLVRTAGTGALDVDTITNADKAGYTASTVSDKAGYSISGAKTTLDALNDFDAANDDVAVVTLVTTTTTNSDMVTEPPTAVQNRQEMDSNSTQLAAIVADTNELQTDDVPGLIAALNDISVDDVWNEAQAGHATAGSFGLYLDTEVSGVGGGTAQQIADATWATATSTSTGAGTFGESNQAQPPSLAEMFTVNVGESAGTGSVVKVAQGSAGGNVTVEAFTDAALDQLVLDDTGESAAAAGSVAQLSKSNINGGIEYEHYVEDSNKDPNPDVTITLYSNAALTVKIDQQVTNSVGIATFFIEAGTYYAWAAKADQTFNPNPEVITVA